MHFRSPAILLTIAFTFLLTKVNAQQNAQLYFTSGPTLQQLSETTVHINWVTSPSTTSWVEYGQTLALGKKARNSQHGLFDANLPVEKAILSDLKPGTQYYYRTVSVEIKEYKAYYVEYGDTLYSDIYSFTTPHNDLNSFSFLAFNDVHDRPGFIGDVAKREKDFDFVVLLGDIMGHIDHEKDIVSNILAPASEYFATEKPFFYVRGNHEARGPQARKLIDYIETPDGNFYYSFQYGPVFFIVLDTGEDKPDTNQYYYGLTDFDHYRAQQAAWLKELVNSEEFKEAKFRVLLIHWPVLLREVVASDEIHRHGRRNAQKHFADLLHNNGIDLQLCGHTHRYEIIKPQKGVSNIYTVVGGGHTGQPNSTYTRVDFNGNVLKVSLKQTSGEVIEEFVIGR
jgi:acid phosphatase type 7